MTFPIGSPFPLFTDREGNPLDGGYVYIGTAYQNPETNPITVYWDSDGTVPAQQPLRTSGGYLYRNGTPANVFADGSCSIVVRDRRGALVFSSRFLEFGTAASIGFIAAGVGAIEQTVQSKLRQIVNAMDFMNADGTQVAFNGIQDDSTGIEACSLALYNAGGGIMYMPPGTAVLGTLSSDSDAHVSYIVARDNVSMVGAGRGVTVLKIKSGENARFPSSNAPNVIATTQSGPLTNCRFSDFTIDWNGANNLLTNLMTARNNAGILTIEGAQNLTIERVNVKETPGNQCFLISNSEMATTPGGNVVVRDCEFRDCGSGLPGNYNLDHSSAHIYGNDILVENCVGVASQTVNGALYELHGSRATGRGNKSQFYQRGCWIAADYNDCEDILLEGDMHTDIESAFAAVVNSTFRLDNIKVRDCTYRQKAGATFGSVAYFVNGGSLFCNSLQISGCTFIGTSAANNRFLQHQRIDNFVFEENWVQDFDDATNGFGIVSSNLDLTGSSGLIGKYISIQRNDWVNVRFPVRFQPTTLGIQAIKVIANDFSTAGSGTAVVVNVNAGTGDISDNTLVSGFTAIVSLPGTDDIWGADVSKNWTPVITFATPGDLAVTYSTQAGTVRKFGNRVLATFNIITSAFTHTTASGALLITGLPKAASPAIFTGPVYYGGITDATRPHVTARVAASAQAVSLVGAGSGVGPNTIGAGQMPTGGTVTLVGQVEYGTAT